MSVRENGSTEVVWLMGGTELHVIMLPGEPAMLVLSFAQIVVMAKCMTMEQAVASGLTKGTK